MIKADFKLPNSQISYKNADDGLHALLDSKFVTNPTPLKSCEFPSTEMMSSNEHGDMKLMGFKDSLISHDETGSKCSEVPHRYMSSTSGCNSSTNTRSVISDDSCTKLSEINQKNEVCVQFFICLDYSLI